MAMRRVAVTIDRERDCAVAKDRNASDENCAALSELDLTHHPVIQSLDFGAGRRHAFQSPQDLGYCTT